MLLNIIQRNTGKKYKDNISCKQHDRRDGVVVERSSRMREMGVQSPVGTEG